MPLWTILPLIVLGLVLVVILVALNRPKRLHRDDEPETFPDRDAHLDAGDARPGDTISIPGRGDEFDDLDFRVDRRDRYESGGEHWFELTGRYRGRRVYLELVEDDDLEAWLDRGRESPRLDDLGLDEERLADIDERKDYEATIEWQGERFTYASSEEVGYFEHGRGEGEGFYSWTFLDRDRKRMVWIEKWLDEPFEAGISEKVPLQDIRMFRA
jgi:hypothetical protein